MLELNHVKSFLNLCISYTNIEIQYHKKRDPNFFDKSMYLKLTKNNGVELLENPNIEHISNVI